MACKRQKFFRTFGLPVFPTKINYLCTPVRQLADGTHAI